MPEIVKCPACERETYAAMPECPHCGHAFNVRPEQAEPSKRPVRRTLVGYIGAHWRGDLSLAVSYWVNGALFSIVLYTLIFLGMAVLDAPALGTHLRTSIIVGLGIVAATGVVAIWQWVGIWRAASSSQRRTGRRFWPYMAKLMVILGVVGGTRDLVETAGDLVRGLQALSDPELADYDVTLLGVTDVVFTGAINDDSVAEAVSVLDDPRVRILRIRSQGGLVAPALRLARFVRENRVTVMAEGQCISACVMVLAASPEAAIYPGTVVAFHDIENIADFRSEEVKASTEDQRREVEEFFRDNGIDEWALEETRAMGYWSPTIGQQATMGLIRYVFDPGSGAFVEAAAYCAAREGECD